MERYTLWESFRVGFDAMRAHPKRTILSTTGIVIGVLALVATFAVTDGVDVWARALVMRQSSVQDIVVTARTSTADDGRVDRVHDAPTLGLDDWRAANRIRSGISAATLSYTGQSVIRSNGRTRIAQFVLATSNLADVSGLDVSDGRFFTDAEGSHDESVIVLGHRLAAELAAPHDALWLIGRAVRAGGRRREVIGILAARPGELDLLAFAPLAPHADLAAYSGARATPTLRLQAESVEEVLDARDRVVDWIAQRYGRARDALQVSVGLERLQNVSEGILLTKLVFGLLAALMLAVGGIGIMNVMLASVAERTREIGIRKAVGARRRDIMLHFLAEATTISAIGSVAGLAFGAVVAVGAAAIFRTLTSSGVHADFRASTLLLSMGAAMLVGLLFGMYPAVTAARLTPIEAIQRD
jgi:putative ABC transport system permease protein